MSEDGHLNFGRLVASNSKRFQPDGEDVSLNLR